MKKLLRIVLGNKYQFFVKIFWRFNAIIYPLIFKKKGTLVYAGINLGDSFQKIFYKYKTVYGFEPNPSNYKKLGRFSHYKGVKIYNCALSDKEGRMSFFLPDNTNNVSASLSDFSADNPLTSKRTIEVKVINLLHFLKNQKIDSIDFYLSDIEGYDFKVLSTIKEYLDLKKIKAIQVEALNNEIKNTYKNVSNYEYQFDELLKENYNKTGRGSGDVKAGENFSGASGITLDLLYELKN
jgi:FkbM family methyltransferase